MSGKPYRVDFHWYEEDGDGNIFVGWKHKARFYVASREHIRKLVTMYLRKRRIEKNMYMKVWCIVRGFRTRSLVFESTVADYVSKNLFC